MGFMSKLFSNRFGSKTQQPTGNYSSILPLGFLNNFNLKANAEENATYMACVRAHARHFSKVQLIPYKDKAPDKNKKDLATLLNLRPNPLMSGPQFWKTVAHDYFEGGVSLIYIEWDMTKACQIGGLWPLDVQDNQIQVEQIEGKVYLQFYIEGRKHCVKEEDLIVLRRDADSLANSWGKRDPAIKRSLDVIATTYDGLEKAIKASQFIRFLVQLPTNISNESLIKRQEEYAKVFFKGDGVAFINGGEKVTEVTSNGKWPLAPEIDSIKEDIYEYQGITPEMIKGKFKNEEWTAYYESVIEPLANEVAAELTYKLLSKGERDHGDYIKVCTDPLQIAPLNTKKGIAEVYIRMPVYVPNTVCELLGLPPIEGGDKPYQNLTYKDPNDPGEHTGSGKKPKSEDDDGEEDSDDE